MNFIPHLETQLAELSARAERSLKAGASPEETRALIAQVKEARAALDAEYKAEEIRAAASRIESPMRAETATASQGGGVWRAVAQALKEQRAITANGSGVGTIPGIVRALVDGGKILPKCSLFRAANAASVVPVFSPHLALPAGQAPGGTGISSDSTAVLTGQSITLKPWYSILPVSMDAILSTDIESELPNIFSEAFSAALDKAVLVGTGSGNDALGVFVASASGVTTGADIACAAAGTPKTVDLVKMALQLNSLTAGPRDSLAIVMHANILAPILSETTSGTDPIKVEIATKGTVLGIPVILSTYAPTTLTTGSYVAVGGYFKHYAACFANQLTVDSIKTVGADNVTFQAFVYFNGKPMISSSFARLKTI